MVSVKKAAAGAVAVLVGLVVLVALLYFFGIIGAPSAGVEDVGDWGNASENRTEIETTLWVNNPNPFGVRSGAVEANYTIAMNDVTVAKGNKEGVSVGSGNQTKVVTTTLLNDRLPAWWVRYVRADETIHVRADGTVRANVGPGASHEITHRTTMLEDSKPVVDALSKAANETEGEYPQEAPLYEIRDGWATWGEANETTTLVRFHFRVHNPNELPVPADPGGVTASIDMNDVRVLETRGREFSLENVDRDATIPPGETREVVVVVAMDTQKMDEWFVSHVRRDERTEMKVRLALAFEIPRTDTTVEVPRGGLAYTCEMQTAILVDDRETDTTCGSGGGVTVDDPGGSTATVDPTVTVGTPTTVVDTSTTAAPTSSTLTASTTSTTSSGTPTTTLAPTTTTALPTETLTVETTTLLGSRSGPDPGSWPVVSTAVGALGGALGVARLRSGDR